MVENLTLQGHNLIGLDRRPEGLRTIHQKLPRTPLLQGDAASLPMKVNSCDAVMMLDVLEHVNDRAALAEAYRVVTSGGLVLIMVPALPWLWSFRDYSAGHLRRYGRRAFARLLTDSRFTVLHMTSYQFFLSPLLMITRLLGRHGPALRDFEERPGTFTNAVLKWVTQMELKLGSFITWPWGSSLLAVCQKR